MAIWCKYRMAVFAVCLIISENRQHINPSFNSDDEFKFLIPAIAIMLIMCIIVYVCYMQIKS